MEQKHGFTFRESVSLLTGVDPALILTTVDRADTFFNTNHLVLDLIFQDPAEFPALTICPVSMFVVPKGEILNGGDVPFFLGGDSVTIKCRAGYGVGGQGNTSLQVVTCTESVQVQYCRRIKQEKKVEQSRVYFTVSVISTVCCVLLIGLLFMTCHLKRRNSWRWRGEEEERTRSSQVKHEIGSMVVVPQPTNL
ncbi:hypothetical protein ACHWQZ_G000770 [Mnemiopsis leidyi]